MLPLDHSAILLTCIIAIIGLENQFVVFFRVAVLHRFYCIDNDDQSAVQCFCFIFEPVSSIRFKLACEYSEDSNQSVHPHSLISLSFLP